MSRQIDRYRPSYGRRSIDVPRQCVFIGTTNASEYLTDSTGNRRYWPVTCTLLDIKAIAQDRDQLWAEAVAAYQAGESWWLQDEDLRRAVEAEQEARRVADPWEAIIAAWLEDPIAVDQAGAPGRFELNGNEVAVAAILQHAIGRPVERQTTADLMRVGKILAKLGWKKRKSHGRMVWARGMREVSPQKWVSPETPVQSCGNNRCKSAGEKADTFPSTMNNRKTDALAVQGPRDPRAPTDAPNPADTASFGRGRPPTA